MGQVRYSSQTLPSCEPQVCYTACSRDVKVRNVNVNTERDIDIKPNVNRKVENAKLLLAIGRTFPILIFLLDLQPNKYSQSEHTKGEWLLLLLSSI